MISKQRKQLYIGAIAFCVLASLAVIIISRRPAVEPVITPPLAQPGTTDSVSDNQASKIFPASTKFDTSFFDSDTYKLLKPYKPVSVTPQEIGREDPFKPFWAI